MYFQKKIHHNFEDKMSFCKDLAPNDPNEENRYAL